MQKARSQEEVWGDWLNLKEKIECFSGPQRQKVIKQLCNCGVTSFEVFCLSYFDAAVCHFSCHSAGEVPIDRDSQWSGCTSMQHLWGWDQKQCCARKENHQLVKQACCATSSHGWLKMFLQWKVKSSTKNHIIYLDESCARPETAKDKTRVQILLMSSSCLYAWNVKLTSTAICN